MSATLSRNAQRVHEALRGYKQKRGRNPKQKMLAKLLDVDVSTIERGIRELKEQGVIEARRPQLRSKEGYWKPNRYTLPTVKNGTPSDLQERSKSPGQSTPQKLGIVLPYREVQGLPGEEKTEGVMTKSWEEVTKLREQALSERASGRKHRPVLSKTVDDPSSEPTSSQSVGVDVGEGVGEEVRQYELELAAAQDDINQWHYVNPKTGKQFTAVALVELRREAHRARRAAYVTGR